MKVIIAGKGGSGKSTLTAIAAKCLVQNGYQVLVMDTDESNVGLSQLLDLDEPTDLLQGMGGRKEVSKRIKEARDTQNAKALFEQPWSIADIPTEMVSVNGGMTLIQTGKIREFGEGCACALGMLSLEFLKNLRLDKNQIALVDTEAGVEHMGRGMEKGADLILAVLDPSRESLMLFDKMKTMAFQAERPLAVVLNRMSPDVEPYMRAAIKDIEVAAVFQYDARIVHSGLDGGAIPTDLEGEEALTRFLIQKMG